MGNFINKHFRKKSCVKINLFNNSDRKQSVHYVIPKDNTITIQDKSWLIEDKFVYLDDKRFLTFNLNNDSAFPALQPFQPNQQPLLDEKGKQLSANRFNIAINTNAARQVYQNFEKSMDKMTYVLILQGIVILGLVIGFYFLYQEINGVKTIVEAIRRFTGV